ncbi:hypothetical protein DCS_02299 [Drechmeria coniospora]|uniref:Uncharacterized protein n=1 Tax=Drechmeria coniospora TaxID=98403 RepID=A0A151GVN9_DRECN|nr:hypothetical protein DCS_02299 [Drechmeria coniospora]KYK61158.1 hypothetical protein DCS_02299 [Drechmeria coniospora]
MQLLQQKQSIRHGLDLGTERLELSFLLRQGQYPNRIRGGIHGAQDTPNYQHVPMKHDWTAGTMNHALSQPVAPHKGSMSPPAAHASDLRTPAPAGVGAGASEPAGANADVENLPQYARPLKNCGPTCPLDTLLLGFLDERRQRSAEGLQMHEVIGPPYPSVSSLLNPAIGPYSHPLSKFFTDILATFPDISMLPERVAVLYIMFLVTRWQISPTRENYNRMPEWMHPTPSQLMQPHAAWIDYVPFPVMRDRITRNRNPQEYLFENFFVPFTTTLRLSWPYEESDTLLVLPDSDEVVINPVFERHLRNLDNWKLGNRFLRTFPTLVDSFNLDPTFGTGVASSSTSSVSR